MSSTIAWQLLEATWVTIQILGVSTTLGCLLAVPIALGRVSPWAPVRWVATAWSGFFRGTPLLVQLFFCYFGLGLLTFLKGSFLSPILKDAFRCVLFACTLNMSAYVSEVLRGGILAVPRGEREAAAALGFGPVLLYRLVILPRAFRIMLPALGNEVVLMLKASSLASAVPLNVSALDLTGIARRLADKSYTTEPLFIAGAIYIVLAFALARLFRWLEVRFYIPSR